MADEKEHFKHDFLAERYKTLQKYRNQSLAAEVQPESNRDRRHEDLLRELVQNSQYDTAVRYVEKMAGFCEGIEDLAAAEMYRAYRDRVNEIKKK